MKKIDILKRELRFLPFSRKLVLFGAFGVLLSLFFPWGTHSGKITSTLGFEAESFNAFGIFSIFGWLLLLIQCVSLLLLVREMITKNGTFRGLANSVLWIILGALGMYTIFIALFILSSSYLTNKDSNFEVQISVFLALFLETLLLLGGCMGMKDEVKRHTKESLSKYHTVDTSHIHLEPEVQDEQLSFGDYDEKN
ncbi:hypothetical protein HZA38_00460 [Candidatus Peregrinibacteria bacterium]|nr:hypothetical protein [Candidatus Peregrinibacteria bacterium]